MNPDEQFFDQLAYVANRRSTEFTDLEIKDGGNVYLFDGISTPYNKVADLGGFTEEVNAHAFRSAIDSGVTVPMLHEHHQHELLATTRSGRLKLIDDAKGLRAKAKLVKTDLSARVKALADAGDITGMSTGWVVGDRSYQRWDHSGQKPHRTISNFRRILDVSTTWSPAYPTSEAQFRSLVMQYADSPESWQRILMGAYPQLGELGDDNGGMHEELGETRTVTPPRVGEQQLAAAKRRLQFIQLTGGYDDAS